jgi:CspA family cold shock protein
MDAINDGHIRHWTEPKRGKLRVVVELDLSDALAHQAPELQGRFQERVARYLGKVEQDIHEVLAILDQQGETGTLKWFDQQKGYGFLRGYDHTDIFVHRRQVRPEDVERLRQGQVVRFKRREGRETFEAIDVELEE